ncbi:hypothetical protein V6N13_072262 [Hibiscus sabdariffa]
MPSRSAVPAGALITPALSHVAPTTPSTFRSSLETPLALVASPGVTTPTPRLRLISSILVPLGIVPIPTSGSLTGSSV